MPAKHRIMQVLEATVGGTRRHVTDLCLHLPKDAFSLHLVYSLQRSREFEADIAVLRESGVTVSEVPMERSIRPRSDRFCLKAISRLIEQWQPHVVHGHSSKGGFLARLAAFRHDGVHTVYNPHGFAFQMNVSAWRRGLYRMLERYAGRRTDRLVAVCEGQKRLALENRIIPDERIRVIPNGIEPAHPLTKSQREALRQELGCTPAEILVGCVAALSPQKGVEYLVRAAATVLRERDDVRFVIIGDGVLRRPLQQLAERLGVGERVLFPGYMPDARRMMGAFDLFALPSLWEGQPYALLEAASAEVPVVATAIDGNTDLLADGARGRLVPPADAVGLAVGMLEALKDPETAAQASALAAHVNRLHSMQEMAGRHTQLYLELIGA